MNPEALNVSSLQRTNTVHKHVDTSAPADLHRDSTEHWTDRYLVRRNERYLPHNSEERLHSILAEVAAKVAVPLPRVYEDQNMVYAGANGFRSRGVLHVNTKDVAELSDDAVRGLFAHELGHVKTCDHRLLFAVSLLHNTFSCVAIAVIATGFATGGSPAYLGAAIGLLMGASGIISTYKRLLPRAIEYRADGTARAALGGIDEQVALFVETAKKHKIDLTPEPENSLLGELLDTRTHPPLGNRLRTALQAVGYGDDTLADIIESAKTPAAVSTNAGKNKLGRKGRGPRRR